MLKRDATVIKQTRETNASRGLLGYSYVCACEVSAGVRYGVLGKRSAEFAHCST